MPLPEQISLRTVTYPKDYNWETKTQKYAVVYRDPEGYTSILAVFSELCWANVFLNTEGMGDSYSLMEVV